MRSRALAFSESSKRCPSAAASSVGRVSPRRAHAFPASGPMSRSACLSSRHAAAPGRVQPAGAQSLFGTISGTVVDEQGGALPGADVTLTDQQSKAVQHTTTNADGVFVFAAVSAGTYSVKVELASFNSWEATDIALRLGERRSLPGIKLQLGTLSESVSVTARPEIAPLDSGEKSARLTSEQIQNVPMVGRSTAELLKLLPGMTPISGRHEQQSRIQRRDHRHQRQRRRRQAERRRQFLGQRHPRRRARHRHRRRPCLRPRLQLRHLRQPQPGHGRGVQGPAVELRCRARQGPDHHRRDQQGGRARIPRHRLRLHARLPAQFERVAAQQVQHGARGPRTSRRTSSPTRGSTSAGRCSSRARTSTRTGTACSSSPGTSSTDRSSIPARSSPGCRPQAMRHGDFSNTRSFTRLGNALRQHDTHQSRERPDSGQSDQPGRTAAHQSLPAAQRRSGA